MPFPVTYHSWQTVNLTLCHPPIKEDFGVLLRTCVRNRRLSLYARTQRKTENAPYRGIKSGSCPPAIGGEVGLHKGFDAHKAPDELTMLLVDSRLYLRWLAISASLNPRALIAFRLFSSHHIL